MAIINQTEMSQFIKYIFHKSAKSNLTCI